MFGIILAGGRGRRMGGLDKASVVLCGRTLLDRVVERLSPQVEALALSANGDPARFATRGLPVLADDASLGPLSGVLAGLRWAEARGATHLVTVAVDTPFLPGDLVPRLLLAAEESPGGGAIAESGGRAHPTVALWPVGLSAGLAATLGRGEAKVMDFADRHGAARCAFADERAFLNINTPDDLCAAEAMLEARP